MSVSQILEPVRNLDANKTAILCIGNRLKGDDAAGCAVYDLLNDKIRAGVIDAGTVPENYIGRIIKIAPRNIIIIDAVDFSTPAGSVKLFSPQQVESFSVSTHSASLKLFCDCISSERACRFFLIGIQPDRIDLNTPISNEVQDAASSLAAELIRIFG